MNLLQITLPSKVNGQGMNANGVDGARRADETGEYVKKNKKWEPIRISDVAKNTINPIRKVVEGQIETNPSKTPIALSIGKPFAPPFGHLATKLLLT